MLDVISCTKPDAGYCTKVNIQGVQNYKYQALCYNWQTKMTESEGSQADTESRDKV